MCIYINNVKIMKMKVYLVHLHEIYIIFGWSYLQIVRK